MAWGCGSKEGCVSFLSLSHFFFLLLVPFICSLVLFLLLWSLQQCIFVEEKIVREEGMVVDRLLLLQQRGGDVAGVVVAGRVQVFGWVH